VQAIILQSDLSDTVRLADGRALLAGGLDANFQPMKSAEVYVPNR
jgi:hypothetical protein